MSMKIDVTPRAGGVAVVAPTGRLDLMTAPELKQRLSTEIAAGNFRLLIDLGSISFVDSSGLGALIAGLKAARLKGGDLRIARPGDQAKSVLELTSLHRVLKPHESVETALAGF